MPEAPEDDPRPVVPVGRISTALKTIAPTLSELYACTNAAALNIELEHEHSFCVSFVSQRRFSFSGETGLNKLGIPRAALVPLKRDWAG